MSIGLSVLIWEVFVTIMNVCKYYVTNEKKLKNCFFFADPILISINSDLTVALGKTTYFEDIVIQFNVVYETVYRGKTCYFIDGCL